MYALMFGSWVEGIFLIKVACVIFVFLLNKNDHSEMIPQQILTHYVLRTPLRTKM